MRVRLLAPLTAALVAGALALTAGTAAAAPAPAASHGLSSLLNLILAILQGL